MPRERASLHVLLVAGVAFSSAAAFVGLHEFRAVDGVRECASQRSNL